MRELAESIEHINNQLVAAFGSELLAGNLPTWRVVFANEQIEKRVMTHTDEGFELIHPEVREVKKYNSAEFDGFYILERLVPVSGRIEDGTTDLVTKVSYEPAWAFRSAKGEYLPPRFDVCVFIIESIYAQASKAGTHVKYKDPELSPEYRAKMLDDMMNTLFGNETAVVDALSYGFGVVNPAGKEHFTN